MNSNRKKSDKSCKFVCGADFKKAASIDAHSTITGQTRTGDHRSFFTPRERERERKTMSASLIFLFGHFPSFIGLQVILETNLRVDGFLGRYCLWVVGLCQLLPYKLIPVFHNVDPEKTRYISNLEYYSYAPVTSVKITSCFSRKS